jgi:hypothetical protein
MSAEERCENYVHVMETSHIHFVFDIAYVDSTTAWREGTNVDVRRERLAWCLENARSQPRNLFVIIKDPPPPDDPSIVWYRPGPGWETLLEDWEGRSLPNVLFQEGRRSQNQPLEAFLLPAVQAWNSLPDKR